MPESLLVTGAAGFIGSNFVHYMRRARPERRVIALDKLTYAGNLENLSGLASDRNCLFVKGDICDFALLDGLFKKEGIDAVVNFAAETHVDRSILGPKDFMDTNVMGTFTLLEAVRANWKVETRGGADKGRMFLHVSTDEVYGALGETGSFSETTPYAPNSPYAASKAASDHLVRAYHHTYGLPVVTTNCSNNYGPYQFPEKLIPLMVINALKGKPLPVYGDGKHVRDWLYVEDHCLAIDLVLEKGRIGETYNIGARNEKENVWLVERICGIVDELVSKDRLLAKEFPFSGQRKRLIQYIKDRPGHDRRYAIDPSKIERELGWKPVSTFADSLEKTVGWYVENRAWWERVCSGDYLRYYELQYKEVNKEKKNGKK